MLLGYHTNGMTHHSLLDAIDLLAEIGYRSVAISVGHVALNPLSDSWKDECAVVRERLSASGIQAIIETDAPFLLDSKNRFEPTLMSADTTLQTRRVDFLCRCIEIANAIGSDIVSLWSGALTDNASDDKALQRLMFGLRQVVDFAADREVRLGLEPEPQMFIDTMGRFERLLQWIDAPHLMVTMDVGQLYIQGEVPIADYIRRWADRIVNVHIEDRLSGDREHLMFGEGEMDFLPIIRALEEIGYLGGVHVELNHHSDEAPQSAQQAFEFMNPLINDGKSSVCPDQ